MATIEPKALEAMLAHHATLADGVARRVAGVSASSRAGQGSAPAVAELVAFLAGDVLPHAAAEELTIYRAAGGREGLAETVAAMVEEHRRLAVSVEHLATSGEPAAASAEAEAIGALFAAHVAKENDLLLPALATDEAADLGDLLGQMHRLTEAAKGGTPAATEGWGPDAAQALLALLLDATGDLAGAGKGDRACSLAAAAWATLRGTRPDLAVRVTAALHRLVRSVASEPVTLSAEQPARGPDVGVPDLDVRSLPPAQRHEQIFGAYRALDPGSAFVLVNDHDPKPLRYQFEAEHPGGFTWDDLEAGPRTWRVRIGRASGGTPR